MSDPDNFLSRWSRRKLEPSNETDDALPPETSAEAKPEAADSQAPAAPDAPVSAQEQTQEPPFDPATLPPVESITAGTDIRDFLKPGVPMSLTRAALRRAWTSDPAIRDFIGLAENQWDFTNDSIPGFGPIDPAEVPRLLAKIISSTKDTASAILEGEPERPQPAPPENAVAKSEIGVSDDRENVSTDPGNASTSETLEQSATNDTAERDASHRNKENDATQNEVADGKLNYAHVRHGHGSALPT
jgi:hypothetical protein